MDVITQIFGLLLSLSILVVMHELGHFTMARLFKTKVEKFYLFFNPWFSLFKFKKGDTEYGIGWLPLGGYVKIAGMIDESLDREQLKSEPKPWEFRSKPAWQRLLIMIGGVAVNFFLALGIYSMILFFNGKEYIPVSSLNNGLIYDSVLLNNGLNNGDIIKSINGKTIEDIDEISSLIITEKQATLSVLRGDKLINVFLPEDFVKQLLANDSRMLVFPAFPFVVDSVIIGMPAEAAGFKKGDQILMVDSLSTPYITDAMRVIGFFKGRKTVINVLRNNDTIALSANINDQGKIGVMPLPVTHFLTTKKIEYSFIQSIPAGILLGVDRLTSYVSSIRHVFSKEGAQSIGGFGSIGGLFPKHWDWTIFWEITAFLSIILAFMNILPIPALDGGHVLFLLYEIITQKKPDEKIMEHAQIIGMILLFSLLIYANANDIFRLFN